ncbi:MAG: hypothetical protein GTO63_03825, partial [Anaerolineae bacterium]|nr:hypothetical protein [Anaerolineae bacterium]
DATLDPSPASEAYAKTYFGDPRAGLWHMYTEGWGFTGFIQYDDTNCGYFYNGDFGSAIWDYYTPPPALTIPADTLYFSEYIDLEERRDLLRKCSEEGLKDGIRIFLDADIDVVAVNSDTTHPVWDLFGGVLNWRGLKTIRKGGTTGGTLNAA